MLLTKGKVTAYLKAFAEGELRADEAPDWMAPLFGKESNGIDTFGLADSSIDSIRNIVRFGREGLTFQEQINGLESDSEQLATAVEELSSSATQVAAYAEQVLSAAEQSAQDADSGLQKLKTLVQHMGEVESSISRVTEHTRAFVNQTERITHLTQTVNEIADRPIYWRSTQLKPRGLVRPGEAFLLSPMRFVNWLPVMKRLPKLILSLPTWLKERAILKPL